MARFSRLPVEPGFRGIRQLSRKNGAPGATGNSEGEANPLLPFEFGNGPTRIRPLRAEKPMIGNGP